MTLVFALLPTTAFAATEKGQAQASASEATTQKAADAKDGPASGAATGSASQEADEAVIEQQAAKSSIAKAAVSVASTLPYSGKALKPAVTVKLGGKTLKAGTDCSVSYKNNVGSSKAGSTAKATVTVTGKGKYTGSVSKTFQIKNPSIQYYVHRQTFGWEGKYSKKDGASSGTTGQKKRLEGIYVRLANKPVSGGIQYRTHVQKIGWQGWKGEGQMSGTTGKGYRLEAIQIKLTGEMAKKYDVYYRVHAQKFGWMGWAKNGAQAGTAGYAYRLESVQIKLTPKGGKAPGSTAKAFNQKGKGWKSGAPAASTSQATSKPSASTSSKPGNTTASKPSSTTSKPEVLPAASPARYFNYYVGNYSASKSNMQSGSWMKSKNPGYGVHITGINGSQKNIPATLVVPEKINGVPVVSFRDDSGARALDFRRCTSLKMIELVNAGDNLKFSSKNPINSAGFFTPKGNKIDLRALKSLEMVLFRLPAKSTFRFEVNPTSLRTLAFYGVLTDLDLRNCMKMESIVVQKTNSRPLANKSNLLLGNMPKLKELEVGHLAGVETNGTIMVSYQYDDLSWLNLKNFPSLTKLNGKAVRR